jgi:transposase
MRYVKTLLPSEIQQLEYHYHHSSNHRERQRCQALLLSNKGKNIKALSELFSTDRDTILAWIKRWEKTENLDSMNRLEFLSDAPRSGRPSKLSDSKKKR